MPSGQTLDYPKSKQTKLKYDAFIRAYTTNGRVGSKAAEKAGYSKKNARQQAVKLLAIPYIQEELKKIEDKEKQSFDEFIKEKRLTVRDRIEYAEQILLLGMKKNRFGGATDLSAANRALNTLNEMLGNDDGDGDGAESYTFEFKVKPAKSDVKVTNA